MLADNPNPSATRMKTFENLIPKLVIATGFVLVFAFIYGFMIWNGVLSVTGSRMLPNYEEFVGLEQYARLWEMDRWYVALKNLGIFSTLYVGGSMLLALPVALLAGLVSFFSPCVLPLLPGYLSYATGLAASDIVSGQTSHHRRRILAGTGLFVLGFGAVFVSQGALFGGLGTVIIDEVHAFAADDRGAHLVSILERLTAFCGRDLQRIGLSATVGNPKVIGRWLQGSSRRESRLVDPPRPPAMRDLSVCLLYTSPSPRDRTRSRMPSSA